GQVLSPPVAIDPEAVVLGAGVHTIEWRIVTEGVVRAVLQQAVSVDACWSMLGHDRARNRRSSLKGPTTNARQFVFTVSNLDIRSSPAVATDGTIYVGSDN